MNNNVTIRQIAQKVGVSPMTVSYALRGRGRIGRTTRERVLQVANEMGYRPNASARATRSGRFGCVGLLVCSDSHFSYTPQAMLWGIQKTLEENDIHLTLASLPVNQPVSPSSLPKILREGMVDGMLINYSHQIPPTILEAVATCRIPAVWMNCKLSSDCVYPDDRSASRTLTDEMLARGHKRIAYIGNHHAKSAKDTDRHYSEFDRMAGYSEAVSAAGFAPQIVQTPDELSETEKMGFLRKWLEQEPRPTGVITYRTTTARLVALAAAYSGLRIPEDIEIATFSDWQDEDLGAGIRSHQIPFFDMGRKAVQMLISKIARPSVPQSSQPIPYACNVQESKPNESTAVIAAG